MGGCGGRSEEDRHIGVWLGRASFGRMPRGCQGDKDNSNNDREEAASDDEVGRRSWCAVHGAVHGVGGGNHRHRTTCAVRGVMRG
uniref:Uncharacterized protein n=1 Tax=Oryza meridionalis TaxID=40149 RepID=A0A0E0CZL4_9ORYZ